MGHVAVCRCVGYGVQARKRTEVDLAVTPLSLAECFYLPPTSHSVMYT